MAEKGLNLKIAWVSGDNLIDRADDLLRKHMRHLDSENPNVKLARNTDNFLDDPKKPIVSCTAYLGARAITRGLREGADIIICEFFHSSSGYAMLKDFLQRRKSFRRLAGNRSSAMVARLV